MDKSKMSHKLNLASILGQNSHVPHCKLKESGIKLPDHVSDRLPSDYVIIRGMEADFSDAIQHLNRQDVLGLSLEGCDIGRFGSLEWLNISSSTCIYLFNIASLGNDAFVKGLKMLLENKRIVKVMHDCRRASDCFYHQYNTKPSNVYDTQVADFVANAIKKSVELVTNKVNSLNYCLKLYLKVPEEYLCKDFSASHKHASLPSNNDLLQFFVNNVIYLRILKQDLDVILRMPFRRCIDVYLNVLLKKSDQELQLHCPDSKLVPPELAIENMQVFKFTDKLKPPDLSRLEDKEDPYLRYQRDCKKYQQKYGYGKYAAKKDLEDEDYENIDNNLSFNNRSEIVQFLLDRMFSCDSSDRSAISMTPFDNLSDYGDVSEASGMDMGKLTLYNPTKRREPFSKPKCASKSSNPSYSELPSVSKPLQSTVQDNPPFENLDSSTESCMSSEYASASVVDIKLSNVITVADAKRLSNSKPTSLESSDSSFSRKSHAQKVLAELKPSLTDQRQLSSESDKDVTSDKNHLPVQKNRNNVKDLISDGSSEGSSLSKKSQITHKLFDEKQCLINSHSQLASKSLISRKVSKSNDDVFSVDANLDNVKDSICDTSTAASACNSLPFQKRSDILKKLLNCKDSATNQPSSVTDSFTSSVDANLDNVKDSVCDTSVGANASNSLPLQKRSDILKKFLNRKDSARNQSRSETDSFTSFNLQPPMLLNEAIYDGKQSYSSKSSVSSVDGNSNVLQREKSSVNKSSGEVDSVPSDVDHSNLCVLDQNNRSSNVVSQDEDPWQRLRDAFAEVGPARCGKKVKFVPAGMQY